MRNNLIDFISKALSVVDGLTVSEHCLYRKAAEMTAGEALTSSFDNQSERAKTSHDGT